MATMTDIGCVRAKEPLADRTWFKLGGPAQFFAEPKSIDELQAVVQRSRDEGLQVRLLGGGSNVLVRDEGVSGMVIHLTGPAFSTVTIQGNQVSVGGGAQLANVITAVVGAGLAGLEPLVGIPGTIGGALHGNAGTQAGDIGQWTSGATVMTRAGELVTREELVAETTAQIVMHRLGLATAVSGSAAHYLQSWLDRCYDQAAARAYAEREARKAADYLCALIARPADPRVL